MSFDDDNEFDEDASSEDEQNDQNDQGDDQDDGDGDDNDNDNDQDDDDEGDGDDDDDGEGGDGDDTEMQDATQSSQRSGNKTAGTLTMPSQDSNDPLKLTPTQGQSTEGESQSQEDKDQTTMIDTYEVRPEALTAATYDIVPTVAAPQSTSINCVTATPNLKYVLSGGSDGYVRKYNWPDTLNGKLALTVAQRHPFVDSVVKAGVLVSYWENDEGGGKPETLSPVYSLAVHKYALWALSGCESGAINLQTVRHEEGTIMHRLKQHTSAVSVLQLSPDERSVLSGSWDKKIFDWDLDTGNIIRKYDGSPSQISAVEIRPESSVPVPKAEDPPQFANGTYSSNNDRKPLPNGTANGIAATGTQSGGAGQPSPAPSDHSFSSLFGDDDNGGAIETTFGGPGGDEDNDLFGGAITTDMRPGEEPAEDTTGDTAMIDAPASAPEGGVTSEPSVPAPLAEGDASQSNHPAAPSTPQFSNGTLPNGTPSHSANPHSSEPMNPSLSAMSTDPPTQSANTFLSASIDGSIRIWDRRQSAAVVKMPSRYAPPWCMSAVWSPDGNSFYAGRRNGSVEEYSLHKPLAAPSRTFRFPSGSGPVSALKAMPNGRHLVCASFDILRLYDLQHEEKANPTTGKTPFLIVPGHRTGVVSALYLDPTCRFMISTAGTRGWEGTSTQVLLGYEIGI